MEIGDSKWFLVFTKAREEKRAKEHLEKFIGNTLVLSGDVPLIQKSTLISLLEKQEGENFDPFFLPFPKPGHCILNCPL